MSSCTEVVAAVPAWVLDNLGAAAALCAYAWLLLIFRVHLRTVTSLAEILRDTLTAIEKSRKSAGTPSTQKLNTAEGNSPDAYAVSRAPQPSSRPL